MESANHKYKAKWKWIIRLYAAGNAQVLKEISIFKIV